MKSVVVVGAMVALVGCGQSPMSNDGGIDAPSHDVANDADGSMDALDACMGPSSIAITTPAVSMLYTHGSVMLEATVTGCPLDHVDLEVDGTGLARSLPAPYTFTLDTTTLTEATHTVVFSGSTSSGMRVASAPLTIVVDRTPPTIVSHTPMDGATNVVFRNPVTITFSEPMNTTSASPMTLGYGANNPMASFTSTFMWNADGTQLTITPTSAPGFPNRLFINTGGGVTDPAGNGLPMTFWSWMVPAWVQLGTPIHASTTASGSNAVLRLRADGTPVLVYSAASSMGDQLHVATWDGTNWTPVGMPHANATGGAITDFAMVLDSTGNPDVVWSENDGGGNAIYAAHFDGTMWSSLGPQPINITSTSTAYAPSAARDGMGHLVAAWSESALLVREPAVRRWDGTSWSTISGAYVPLPTGEVFADVPEVAVDPSGNVWLATLSRHSTGSFHLYMFEASSPGTSWFLLGGGPADPNAAGDEHISMILDGHGLPQVAWVQQNISGGTGIASTAWNGSSFATEPLVQAVGSGPNAHAHNPWRRLTSRGDPVIAWIENSSLQAVLYSSSSWMTYEEQPLSDTGMQPANRLTGELDRLDQATMAWTRTDPAGTGTLDILLRVANR